MIFKYGDRNCQSLQEYLNFRYDCKLKVDGIFGKDTLKHAQPILSSPTTVLLDSLEIKIIRDSLSECTEGKLYLNGKYFCDTLEDTERDVKIKNETAIPKGVYKTIINYSPKFKKEYPRLLNVPNFDGILIHEGNTTSDTSGCILVGIKSKECNIKSSKVTFKRLFNIMKGFNSLKTIIQ